LKKEATFTVSHTIFLIPLSTEILTLNEEIRSAYDFLKITVKKYPEFPDKDKTIQAIDELFTQLDQMTTGLNRLEIQVKQLNDSLRTHAPDLPDEVKKQLIGAANQADNTLQETRRMKEETGQALQKSKETTDWCYIWMAYYDLCEQLKFYNNFLADNIKGIAQNLGQAKVIQGLPADLQNIIGNVAEALTADVKNPVDVANKIMGKMADLGSYVYNRLLENCTTYSGEAKGQYETVLRHKNMTFYKMSYKLTGKVELTFQKRKPGDPAVYLKGRFKGKMNQPACFITMAPFAVPDTIGPVWCLAATPLVASRSFFLYLEGKASDQGMELKLEKAERDFKLRSRAFYVLLSSAAFSLPIPGDFSFPLQNAEWFLTRVTKISNPSIEYFKIPIEARGNTSRAEKEFERTIDLPETAKRVGVKVHLKLKFTLCSPKCN
jgi:hypothetical protein